MPCCKKKTSPLFFQWTSSIRISLVCGAEKNKIFDLDAKFSRRHFTQWWSRVDHCVSDFSLLSMYVYYYALTVGKQIVLSCTITIYYKIFSSGRSKWIGENLKSTTSFALLFVPDIPLLSVFFFGWKNVEIQIILFPFYLLIFQLWIWTELFIRGYNWPAWWWPALLVSIFISDPTIHLNL